MPVKSAVQRRLMEGITHGSIPRKGSLTRAVAAEFLDATPQEEHLPGRLSADGRKGSGGGGKGQKR